MRALKTQLPQWQQFMASTLTTNYYTNPAPLQKEIMVEHRFTYLPKISSSSAMPLWCSVSYINL